MVLPSLAIRALRPVAMRTTKGVSASGLLLALRCIAGVRQKALTGTFSYPDRRRRRVWVRLTYNAYWFLFDDSVGACASDSLAAPGLISYRRFEAQIQVPRRIQINN